MSNKHDRSRPGAKPGPICHGNGKAPEPGLGKIIWVDLTFWLTDFVPSGHHIWNIGRNMLDGYLPLCILAGGQPFPGGMNIQLQSLKAIKCEGAQTILAAVGYGPETPEEMEKFIEMHGRSKPGSRYCTAVQRMERALPYMRKIRWS